MAHRSRTPSSGNHLGPRPKDSGRVCKHCGCTDLRACIWEGVPCHWVTSDECSACLHKILDSAAMEEEEEEIGDAPEWAKVMKKMDGRTSV